MRFRHPGLRANTDAPELSAAEVADEELEDEFVEPAPTAGVVIIEDEQVLLVAPGRTSRHPLNVFGLPSGHLEEGESTIDCAVRECLEETGLVVAAEDLLELPRHYTAELPRRDGSSELMSCVFYTTRRYSGRVLPTDETEPGWVHLHALSQLELQRNVADAIAQAVQVLGPE